MGSILPCNGFSKPARGTTAVSPGRVRSGHGNEPGARPRSGRGRQMPGRRLCFPGRFGAALGGAVQAGYFGLIRLILAPMISAVSAVDSPVNVLVAESAFQPDDELPPPPLKLNGPMRRPAETSHLSENA